MAPPVKTGIKTVIRKRRDGSVATYHYDRKTGRNLGPDRDAAIDAALSTPARDPEGTFAALASSYLASSKFRDLAPKTQALNRMYVDRLRDIYGPLPVAAITRPVVMALREKHSDRKWYATHLLAKLRLVLQYGVDIGALRTNHALKPGGLKPPRRHEVWTPADTDAMIATAGPDIRLACALLLYSAQRPADALSMRWEQISERDGRLWISLRQAKTGELIDVPAHRELEKLLRAADRRAALLVPSPTGKLWLYRNFSRAWDACKTKAGISGVQRRDLRRTAMVRMAEAGATTAQIAAVSGHTIDQTSRILDTYIPRRGEVAAGAIDAWERGSQRQHVIKRNDPH